MQFRIDGHARRVLMSLATGLALASAMGGAAAQAKKPYRSGQQILDASPASDWRTNSRPVARAIDLPRLVLPTPGGPTRHRIGPFSLLVRA